MKRFSDWRVLALALAFLFLAGLFFVFSLPGGINLEPSAPKMPAPVRTAAAAAVPKLLLLYNPGDGESDLTAHMVDQLILRTKDRLAAQKVDLQKEPEAAEYYNVQSIPTIIIISTGGKTVFRREGYIEPQLLVNQLLAAGMKGR